MTLSDPQCRGWGTACLRVAVYKHAKYPSAPFRALWGCMKKLLLAGVAALFAIPAVSADLPTRRRRARRFRPKRLDRHLLRRQPRRQLGQHELQLLYDLSNGAFVDGGSANASSFVGGGEIGYRDMFPQRIVIGAEANLDWNSGSGLPRQRVAAENKYYQSTSYSSGLGGSVAARPATPGATSCHTSRAAGPGPIRRSRTGRITAPWERSPPAPRSRRTLPQRLDDRGRRLLSRLAELGSFAQYMYTNYGTATINFIAPLSQSVRTSLNTQRGRRRVNLEF